MFSTGIRGNFLFQLKTFYPERFWLGPREIRKILQFNVFNSNPSRTSDDVPAKTDKACSCKISMTQARLVYFLSGVSEAHYGSIGYFKAKTQNI